MNYKTVTKFVEEVMNVECPNSSEAHVYFNDNFTNKYGASVKVKKIAYAGGMLEKPIVKNYDKLYVNLPQNMYNKFKFMLDN